jgi:GTP-binding protein HflX
VDASDPGFERQLHVTEEVLAEIGAGEVPRLLIFNKIDRVEDPSHLRARWPDGVVMSAKRPADVAALRLRFVEFFAKDLIEAEVGVPYDRQHLRGEIFGECQVLEEKYEDDKVVFKVRAHPTVIERLRAASG